ncbi:hypothetical protein GCM10008019_34090 [Deinococcus soli (ex Cha et al. 2016)]|nr:hypothetical protein GCM10008019_34090 [Deinococcus soli (ex Cha et al. 2016)]
MTRGQEQQGGQGQEQQGAIHGNLRDVELSGLIFTRLDGEGHPCFRAWRGRCTLAAQSPGVPTVNSVG